MNLQTVIRTAGKGFSLLSQGFALLGAVGGGGVSVWRVSLAVRQFLCAGKYITSLIMRGAALSTRLMGALRFRRSCS